MHLLIQQSILGVIACKRLFLIYVKNVFWVHQYYTKLHMPPTSYDIINLTQAIQQDGINTKSWDNRIAKLILQPSGIMIEDKCSTTIKLNYTIKNMINSCYMMLSNSILITICCKAFALNIECVNIIFEPRTHHFEKVDLVSYTVTAGVFSCHNEFPQKKLDLTSLQKGSGTFLFLFCDASYNLFVNFFYHVINHGVYVHHIC